MVAGDDQPEGSGSCQLKTTDQKGAKETGGLIGVAPAGHLYHGLFHAHLALVNDTGGGVAEHAAPFRRLHQVADELR